MDNAGEAETEAPTDGVSGSESGGGDKSGDTLMRRDRPRRKLVMSLIVIAAIAGLISIFSTWILRQTLESSTWSDTSAELVQDPEIQQALSTFLVDQLYDNVDVTAEIETLLPKDLKGLAGPAAGGLRPLADKVALEALTRPAVQTHFEQASDSAHATFVEIVDGGGNDVSTSNGEVVLNLSTIVDDIAKDVGIGADVASKLPPDVAEIQILKSNELSAIQTGVDVFRVFGWVIYLVAIGLFILAVALASGWRRVALRNVAVAFITIGLLTLIIRSVAGNALVPALAGSTSVEPAVDSAWGIITGELARIANTAVFLGLLFLIGAWLAGPAKVACRLRAAVAPYLAEPVIIFPAALVLLLLLTWWSPAGVMDRFQAVVIVAVLLGAGAEVFRRQLVAEFPEEANAEARGDLRRQRIDAAKRGSLATWKRATGAASGATSRLQRKGGAADSGSARLEHLERLGSLKQSGVLSEEEFEAEKSRVLAGSPESGSGA